MAFMKRMGLASLVALDAPVFLYLINWPSGQLSQLAADDAVAVVIFFLLQSALAGAICAALIRRNNVLMVVVSPVLAFGLLAALYSLWRHLQT